MKYALTLFISVVLSWLNAYTVSGQNIPGSQPNTTKGEPDSGAEIDSLRKLEEEGQDTVVFTARYIRYTTLELMQDSTQTIDIDTSLNNLQNYNILYQPARPVASLGNLGLAYRDMLFSPRKNIGFDAGFHSLDLYLFTPDSLKFYRARTPYSQLYYVNGGQQEQLFRATHSQNIKPNWNIGAVYNRIGAQGFYQNQKGDHTNIAVNTWYQSPGKRYNLLADMILNTLKAAENGSVLNDSIYIKKPEAPGRDAELVRLGNGVGQGRGSANTSRQTLRNKTFFLKQFYYIGRIDSLGGDTARSILPTQRVSYAFSYNADRYKYSKNEPDPYDAFPAVTDTAELTKDSTEVSNLRNELMYSFYLRGRSVKFLKNQLKLDIGIQHDAYTYRQLAYKKTFQTITLKANAGYRFSDRVDINLNLQQIAQGPYLGDFLYEATSNVLISRSLGRVVLGAYLQNKSPEEIFQRVNYQYHKWDLDFDRTKTTNLSFLYKNPKYSFTAKAEYYLVSNYLYLRETSVLKQIAPTQAGSINLLKISAGKSFTFAKFSLDNYLVYQKTDSKEILRLPELYVYNSLYFSNRFFGSIDAQIGFDSRFNTSYAAPAYAINVSQFYNDAAAVKFKTYPLIDVWLKASLKRANIFFKYNYINQGLLSKGYYTVNRYPMPDAGFRFGVAWNFYN